ncbi:MAG: hypothetical protein HS111_27015 [Kofleriaceae bacterium]|nr:hypothetical protein [Kofleriaceae bacterium]
MKRAPRSSAAGVSWRDGVHVLGTAIWCDARRARAVCFVSAADRTGRAGHGQLIATAETLALLGARQDAHLAAPTGRPFTLGTVRLELVRSGHAVGAAALLVDTGHRVLYAGAVDPAGGGLGGAAELRRCDTLVVAAPYGAPHHRFPATAGDVVDFARVALATGAVPVVLVTSSLKALDAAAAPSPPPACPAPATAPWSRPPAAWPPPASRSRLKRTVARGRPLVLPLADRARLGAALGGARARVALASGLAVERELVRELGVDAAIPWSAAADRAALLAYVARSGAREIAITGEHADDVVAELGGRARRLGPPRQMALFAAS